MICNKYGRIINPWFMNILTDTMKLVYFYPLTSMLNVDILNIWSKWGTQTDIFVFCYYYRCNMP